MSLELKLRRLHGDSFQEFFSTVMERLHGEKYVRVRAFGKLGDKGCDGYLQGVGQLFQCYGKLHDAALSVATLITKMDDDYAKAAAALATIMKEWHFVHNLVDGVPVEAVQKLDELKRTNAHHEFGMVGQAGFEQRIFSLPEHHIIELLGPAATAEDTRNMRVEEVGHLIEAVVRGLDGAPTADANPDAVPHDKLEFNKITGTWRNILETAFRNAPYVQDYVGQHPDPEVGKRVAKVFANRYAELRTQQLRPNAILTSLYEGITGIGSVPPERQVAAQALLAYLFEACDIFEDHPSKVIA